MNSIVLVLFFTLGGIAQASKSSELYARWGKLKQPIAGKAESIGVYSAGCLSGALALPMDGIGYSVMRPSRLRYYGHPDLITFVQNLGAQMHTKKMPRLLVGDLGRPRGGPMISGHASHQSGLDVDLWFHLASRKPKGRERETWSSPSLVVKNKKVKPGWTKNHRQLVVMAAAKPEVERVFVNPAIKKDLCEKFPSADWQYKVRAWWGHDDHLHVRLFCPKENAGCRPQDPLDPKENQCGETLAWWFSKEAEEEWAAKRKQIAEREFPELPKACAQMTEAQEHQLALTKEHESQ